MYLSLSFQSICRSFIKSIKVLMGGYTLPLCFVKTTLFPFLFLIKASLNYHLCHTLIALASLGGRESGEAGGGNFSCGRPSQLTTLIKGISETIVKNPQNIQQFNISNKTFITVLVHFNFNPTSKLSSAEKPPSDPLGTNKSNINQPPICWRHGETFSETPVRSKEILSAQPNLQPATSDLYLIGGPHGELLM